MERHHPSVARHGSTTRPVRRFISLALVLAMLSVFGQVTPVEAAVPTVSSVSPRNGPLKGGQIVLIKGKNFTGTTAVKFDTTDATNYSVMSDTEIVATVPDKATAGAVVNINVTNGDGTNSSGATYEYFSPTITKISPAYADDASSATITITGKGLSTATASDVLFGSDAALAVWVISDTQIVATTPEDDTTPDPDIEIDSGEVDVTVTINSVASATGTNSKFLFTPGLPTITQLGQSAQGDGTEDHAVGDTLRIVGTQLWGATKVNFGSSSATPSDVATDGTYVEVTVPSRSNGPVDVTVTNARGTSLTNLKTEFPYYSSNAPTITSLSPNVFDKADSGGGGTLLVTGRDLTGVKAADVSVDCATPITPTSATSISDTSLILVIPGNGDTAETCDLTIENPNDDTKTTTKADAVRFV